MQRNEEMLLSKHHLKKPPKGGFNLLCKNWILANRITLETVNILLTGQLIIHDKGKQKVNTTKKTQQRSKRINDGGSDKYLPNKPTCGRLFPKSRDTNGPPAPGPKKWSEETKQQTRPFEMWVHSDTVDTLAHRLARRDSYRRS